MKTSFQAKLKYKMTEINRGSRQDVVKRKKILTKIVSIKTRTDIY